MVGEAGTAEDALELIPQTKPDVAVLDVRLGDRAGGTSGIEVCRQIRSDHPEVACLMLTSFADDEALFASIMAGASGYVLKQIRGAELVSGIRRVADGDSLLDPSVTARVLERLRHPEPAEPDPLADLTPQERGILDHIAEGMTNRQIGEAMFLAEKTVKNYVSNLLTKLGHVAPHRGGGLRGAAGRASSDRAELMPLRHVDDSSAASPPRRGGAVDRVRPVAARRPPPDRGGSREAPRRAVRRVGRARRHPPHPH